MDANNITANVRRLEIYDEVPLPAADKVTSSAVGGRSAGSSVHDKVRQVTTLGTIERAYTNSHMCLTNEGVCRS